MSFIVTLVVKWDLTLHSLSITNSWDVCQVLCENVKVLLRYSQTSSFVKWQKFRNGGGKKNFMVHWDIKTIGVISQYIFSSFMLNHQAIVEIWPHFLFGDFAIKFNCILWRLVWKLQISLKSSLKISLKINKESTKIRGCENLYKFFFFLCKMAENPVCQWQSVSSDIIGSVELEWTKD